MALPEPVHRYTPAEYYALEEKAAFKSDYYDGEIFAMAGGSSEHSLISINLARELSIALKGKPCAAYDPNMRLKVKATGLRTYPDVSVYCGQAERDPEDPTGQTFTNPTLLFEILSPTTEAYDRGVKAFHYRQIASLQAYVLVSQDAPRVEVYFRQPDRSWSVRDLTGLEKSLELDAIQVVLPLAEVYDRIAFAANWHGAGFKQ